MVWMYEEVNTQALEDMKALLKEYARRGYGLLHNYQDSGFEELWSEVFPTNGREPTNAAVPQHPRFPTTSRRPTPT
jgi:hypothetical protein